MVQIKTVADMRRFGGMEYRLGDLYYGTFKRINATRVFCGRWPASIGCEFAKSDGQAGLKITRLMSIVRSRGTVASTQDIDNHSLRVHLRVGDVLDWTHYQSKFGCDMTRGCLWVNPLIYYRRVRIPREVSSVVIVANPCWRVTKNCSRSREYVNNVANIMRSRRYSVRLRLNSSADDDFMFMVTGRYFLAGRGRFSTLMTECAKRNGANVLI